MLVRLSEHDQVDWGRASIDESSASSSWWAGDGHKSIGCKQHIVGDARGTSAGDLRQECQ